MKQVKFASKASIYSLVFFLLVNISDAKPHKFPGKQEDCKTHLMQMNQALKEDPDGILNEDEIADYEQCVTNIEGEMDLSNASDFILLLDCYDDLMDYYEYVEHDEYMAAEYEDKIHTITE